MKGIVGRINAIKGHFTLQSKQFRKFDDYLKRMRKNSCLFFTKRSRDSHPAEMKHNVILVGLITERTNKKT
jgi:hypothetical protein